MATGFLGLKRLATAADGAGIRAASGYGLLRNDPAGVLALPEGFSYRIISVVGSKMDDGFRVPAAHDGMGAFAGPDGRTILVCNHELSAEHDDVSMFGPGLAGLRQVDATRLYDAGRGKRPMLGGTTTLVYDPRTGRAEREFMSLAGTDRNCAGGPTPWNSWITCEETSVRADSVFEKDHGYNFEVPASMDVGLVDPVPLVAMGRFRHEAVAVDTASGVIYQTEDMGDGLIYRYLPKVPGNPAAGGRLQALRIRERPSADTRNWRNPLTGAVDERFPRGERWAVDWVDLDHPESPEDDLRYRGFAAGAARFARGEGMWYGNGEVYFACTNGGEKQAGQVFRYIPSAVEGTVDEARDPGWLDLFIEPNDTDLMENCDNLTVAPWGDLFICEDRGSDCHVRGVTPEGELFTFARNELNDSEFAGACFSPDGSTLFVNIQWPGMTVAIRGPWDRRMRRG